MKINDALIVEEAPPDDSEYIDAEIDKSMDVWCPYPSKKGNTTKQADVTETEDL